MMLRSQSAPPPLPTSTPRLQPPGQHPPPGTAAALHISGFVHIQYVGPTAAAVLCTLVRETRFCNFPAWQPSREMLSLNYYDRRSDPFSLSLLCTLRPLIPVRTSKYRPHSQELRTKSSLRWPNQTIPCDGIYANVHLKQLTGEGCRNYMV